MNFQFVLLMQKIIVKVKSFKKGDADIAPVRAQESSEEVQEWLNKITQS
ncbi:MAG: hypothetical protein RLZZ115_1039, partial [Cyanobacteriota bacterium]